jgi:alcohol dehydrogenase class IV
MVPTTAGSGSEVSQEAVVTDLSAGTKFAVKDPKLVPTCAIVDPMATATCPSNLTAICGMDALTHALEAFTARDANAITDMYALKAVALLLQDLPQAVASGNNSDARLSAALGALLAGQAFNITGTAAVHACGYPLSGLYGIPHGAANALMLPHVIAFNAETCAKYEQLYPVFGTPTIGATLGEIVQRIGLPTRLRDVGVERKSIHRLATIAAKDERHLSANPRAMTIAELESIFEKAW